MQGEELLPIRILRDFVERVEKLDIAYMLTGSMAMMRYSVYRFTADVDMVLELQLKDAERIIGALEPDYYVPHSAVSRAIESARMFNVIHRETAFKVDCAMKKSDEFQKNAFERRERTDFYGKELWIISKEDLIITKLWRAKDSHSDKQLSDVKNLLKAGFDAEYTEKWTTRLGVYDLFDRCRKEIK